MPDPKYARIIRDGVEVLEPLPLRAPESDVECTPASHAEALDGDDGTASGGLEYRELPGDPMQYVACRHCGEVLATSKHDAAT